jgi:hypothetical protein
LEHYYFVDIAGMALWSDGKIENNEAYFYILLLTLFQFQMLCKESILSTDAFIAKHKKRFLISIIRIL